MDDLNILFLQISWRHNQHNCHIDTRFKSIFYLISLREEQWEINIKWWYIYKLEIIHYCFFFLFYVEQIIYFLFYMSLD